jgi:NitT/TauT family transport system substrate-binding protein
MAKHASGAAARGCSQVTRIRIGVAFHSPFYTPLFVTDRLGYFRDERLEATITVPPPGGAIDMLLDGTADLVLSGVMRSFILADRGGPKLIAIAEVNSRDGFFILSCEPAPQFSWRDLEGKRLALFGLAPTPWICLQTAMREQGADPTKVEVRPGFDVAQGIEALRSGKADYLQTGQPVAEELILDGVAHLASPQAPVVGHVPYSSFIVTDETRRKRADLCTAAVRALTRGLVWIHRNSGEAIAAQLSKAFPDVRDLVMTRAVWRMKELSLWADGPRQDRAAFERLGRMLVAGGLIQSAAPYDDLNDDQFAEAGVSAQWPR